MVTLHWDLGRGWEKFEGKDEIDCLILALKSRGFGITENGGSLWIKKGDEFWNIACLGEARRMELLNIIRENLPFGIGRFEKELYGVNCVMPLSGGYMYFENLRAVSFVIANEVINKKCGRFEFSLSGVRGDVVYNVFKDLRIEGRSILSSTITLYNDFDLEKIADTRKAYIKFFKDDKDSKSFLSDAIFEKLASLFFNCFNKELCEKIREFVDKAGRY